MGLTDEHLVYGDDIPNDTKSYKLGNSQGYTEGYDKGYADAKNKYEKPKGEWIEVEGYDGDTYYECNQCGEPWVLTAGTPKDNDMNFCPKCGADMRGGAE